MQPWTYNDLTLFLIASPYLMSGTARLETCSCLPTRQCEQVKVASCLLRETTKTGAWNASDRLQSMATCCNMSETSLSSMRVQKIFWNCCCEWKHACQPGRQAPSSIPEQFDVLKNLMFSWNHFEIPLILVKSHLPCSKVRHPSM